MSDFYSKLIKVQATLNAPKNQYNKFGKYSYRNCEDILEAAKPLLKEHGLFLFINDHIEMVGDRFYVKATATITDGKDKQEASAYAREEVSKKGMDAAQLTGATSSYARKYALNGLLCIDDNKDADSNEQRQQIENKPVEKLSKEDQKKVKEYAEKYGYSAESICQAYKVKSLGDLNADMARPVCEQIKAWAEQLEMEQNHQQSMEQGNG